MQVSERRLVVALAAVIVLFAAAIGFALRVGTQLGDFAAVTAALAIALAGGVILLLWGSFARLRRDAESRAQMVEQLREAQQRNQAVFEQSGDFLFIVDCSDPDDCFYEAVNRETERLLGRPAAEIRGKRPRELTGAERGRRTQEHFARCARSGEALRYENDFGEGEDRRVLDVLLMPLRDRDGRVTQLLGSARDITDARRAEEALRQSQKLEAIGQLTGGLAHDFNNLLQVVVGNLELVAGEVADPEKRRRLRAATAAAQRGQELTRRLLAFARSQKIEPRSISVERTLERLRPVLRASVGEAIQLTFDLPADLWPVKLDPVQLENAILNLVVNARDAMPGGGSVSVGARNAKLGTSAAARLDVAPGDYVAVSVVDSGSGIPPELLTKVFQPFFTTKPAGKGTGLGLSTVYGIARQSGGTASIRSFAGRGTTVMLHLPRSEEAPAELPADEPVVGGRESILVVEDDAEVRATTADLLRGLGYAVTEVGDGRAAQALLENGTDVDLLLTDVVMPGGLDGIELARRARQLRPGIAVLVASSHADEGEGHDFERLDKPFDRAELARRLRQALAGRTQHSASANGNGPGPPARPAEHAAGAFGAVLLVEDEPLVRSIAVESLRDGGYECVEAGTAAAALAALAARPVIAAIVDLGLPDLSGAELLRRLRALRPELPLVISSGDEFARRAVAGLPGRAPAFVGKPYSPSVLLRALRGAIAE